MDDLNDLTNGSTDGSQYDATDTAGSEAAGQETGIPSSTVPSTEVVKRADARTHRLSRAEQRQLKRELAAGEVRRSALARKYGISAPYVTQFAKQYKREIDEIKSRLDDEFAGMWIADKEQRILAYQADYEMASDGKTAGHHEWIKARATILKNVAEELGQLPGKQPVIAVAVTHIIEGVDLEALR